MDKDIKLKEKVKKITWPIFVETALMSLLGSVDTLMLSKYSDASVAAAGIANQIIWLLNITFGIITTGTAILITQYLGAKSDKKTIIQISGISIGLNTIVGVLLSGLLIILSIPILNFLKTPKEVITLADQYVKIVGGSIFIQAISMTLTSILRSHSKTKICMNATIVMNVVNVILNYIFIFGKLGFPAMGIGGAAIATAIGKLFGLLILIKASYDLILKDFKNEYFKPFPKEHLINIFKIGVPTAGEQISYNLSQLVITSFINILGVVSIAARSYIGTVVVFSYIFAIASGQGSSIVIGELIGNKEEDRARNLCIYVIKRSLIVSLFISLIICLLGRNILGLLTEDINIIRIAAKVLILEIPLELGRCVNIVGINGLRATGDVKFPVYIGIFSMWIFGVGLSYIMGVVLELGLAGIWIGFTVDEWFRAVLVLLRWRRGNWRGKSFIK